jgi:hypothetical protein
LVRVKKILMRVKTILMYFRKNTADNLTFNVELVELVNGDLEVVVKVVEVQKDVQDVVVVVAVDPRSAFEDAGSGRAEDARQQVAQVAVGAERARGCGGRSAAARALGGAAGALGGASDRVGARIGSPPVGPHFS